MTQAILRSLTSIATLSALVACSGGGGGSGGGSGTATSLIQTSKLTCNGATCIGSGSLSFTSNANPINTFAITDAVTFYDAFNKQMIPALNNVIRIVETGAANAGAVSCNDISVPFTGQVSVDGTTYNAKTATSSATAPSDFTLTTMAKTLSAELASNSSAVIKADVQCGAGTDVSPLVARVLAVNGTTKLNAWFEKGSSNHIRVLMIVESAGTKYAAWFKTDNGNLFEIVLASGGAVYKGVGSKTSDVIAFRDNGAGSDACIVASTGASATGLCGSMATSSITATGIPNTLTVSTAAWASVAGATLIAPTF